MNWNGIWHWHIVSELETAILGYFLEMGKILGTFKPTVNAQMKRSLLVLSPLRYIIISCKILVFHKVKSMISYSLVLSVVLLHMCELHTFPHTWHNVIDTYICFSMDKIQ